MPTLIETPGGATSNTYSTLAEADAYFESRLHTDTWDAAVDADKERGLLMAARLLDANWIWNGRRTNDTQRMEWPRTGVLKEAGTGSWDWNFGFFRFLDENEIPRQLKEAQAEFAALLLASDTTANIDQSVQGITSLRAGSVSLSFKESIQTSNPVPDSVFYLIPYFWGELRYNGTGVRTLERA
jgi:hypothetical protein